VLNEHLSTMTSEKKKKKNTKYQDFREQTQEQQRCVNSKFANLCVCVCVPTVF